MLGVAISYLGKVNNI